MEVAHKKRGRDARIGSAIAVLHTSRRPFDPLFIRLLRIIQLGVTWLARSPKLRQLPKEFKDYCPLVMDKEEIQAILGRETLSSLSMHRTHRCGA